jgi:putative DNA methylase
MMQFSYQPALLLTGADDATAVTLPIDADFDVDFADSLARLESYNKHYYRPNSYLHKWWARRCGSTFRLILKGLVANEAQRDYYVPGGLQGKVVLDPMMGGGTTLHEAIRLGATVIGADIDPLPILQARATLSDMPLARLESAFAAFYTTLATRLEALFTTTCPTCVQTAPLRFVLYGCQRSCACGPSLFVDSLLLRQETDGTAVWLCRHCHNVYHQASDGPGCRCGGQPDAGKTAILEKSGGRGRCDRCRQLYTDDLDTPYFARYRPLAVSGDCPAHGFFLAPVTAVDLAHLDAANQARAALDWDPSEFAVGDGPKSLALRRRGIHSYLDLFSSRQLLYLQQAIALLPAYEPLIRLNLGLLVSTSLEFNSLLCGYKGAGRRRAGATRHTFSLHAYSFPYTALENNLLYPGTVSGSLQKLFHDRCRRARQWARRPRERRLRYGRAVQQLFMEGERDAGTEVTAAADLSGGQQFLLLQGSAAALDLPDDSVDFVVTDPPYFDSVQYSDLAIFFHVWLRRLLPDGPSWRVDLAQSAVEPQVNGNSQYTAVIANIFGECHRVLRKENGRLIFTFHHWNPKGWTAVTLALRQAGFVLVNRYVVHSENPLSVHIAGFARPLLHDAILVLAPLAAGVARAWTAPLAVDQSDSRQFCYDCATLLGWLLNSDLSPPMIEQSWQRYLG